MESNEFIYALSCYSICFNLFITSEISRFSKKILLSIIYVTFLISVYVIHIEV